MASGRDPRLDALKAIAISFVVVWHLHPIYVEGWAPIERMVAFFDFEMSLTAVPTFLIVSLWLFLPRASQGGAELAKRLWRLGQIFLFWVAVQTAIYIAVQHKLPALSLELIQHGGPELPRIGGSVFYYLFNLIALTAAAAVFARIPEPWRARAGWVIVLGSLLWFEVAFAQKRILLYDRIDSFVLYVPVTFYLTRLVRLRLWFVLGWIAFAARDMYFGRAADCVYGRVAIFCGALALIGFVWSTTSMGQQKLARTLSTYSLGIYALHKYCLYALLVWKGARSLNVHVGSATIHVAAVLLFIGTAALTAMGIAILWRTPLRRFVA